MPLTERGKTQARQLGAQLHCLRVDVAVATRFLRTQQTAELALDGRDVPLMIEPHFAEVRAGTYDEAPVDTYWAWEEQHPTSQRLPQGESVDEAFLRIADGLQRLLSRTEPVTLSCSIRSPCTPSRAPRVRPVYRARRFSQTPFRTYFTRTLWRAPARASKPSVVVDRR
jgi:hypothetical protein